MLTHEGKDSLAKVSVGDGSRGKGQLFTESTGVPRHNAQEASKPFHRRLRRSFDRRLATYTMVKQMTVL